MRTWKHKYLELEAKCGRKQFSEEANFRVLENYCLNLQSYNYALYLLTLLLINRRAS